MTADSATRGAMKRDQQSGGLREAALLRLSTGIAAAETEQEICEAVTAGLEDASLGFDYVAVLLVDAATGDRVVVSSRGSGESTSGLRVRPGEGLSELPLAGKTVTSIVDPISKFTWMKSISL